MFLHMAMGDSAPHFPLDFPYFSLVLAWLRWALASDCWQLKWHLKPGEARSLCKCVWYNKKCENIRKYAAFLWSFPSWKMHIHAITLDKILYIIVTKHKKNKPCSLRTSPRVPRNQRPADFWWSVHYSGASPGAALYVCLKCSIMNLTCSLSACDIIDLQLRLGPSDLQLRSQPLVNEVM